MSLKILSWNINGLRSVKPNLKEFLTSLDADIICLQETKVTRDMLEESQAIIEGYSSYFSFSRKKSGYSGVATYCSQRATPFAAQEGLSGLFPGELSDGSGTQVALPGTWKEEELKDLDSEGRAVITQHRFKEETGKEREVTVINVYCPRVDPEKPERRGFKLRYYELMRQRAAAVFAADSHVVILGDINCSHKRIDHCDPDKSEAFENRLERRYLDNFLIPLYTSDCREKSLHDANSLDSCKEENNIMKRNTSETNQEISEMEPEEEQADDHLLSSQTTFQMVDTFRYFYPQKEEAFTCWNVSTNSRSTNYGTRLDYIFCDEGLLPHIKDSLVLQDIMGSDHCPVVAEVKGTLIPSTQLPSCCTKFFPEFRGEQQKLSSYFKPKCASDESRKMSLHKSSHPSEMRSMPADLLNTSKRKIENGITKSKDKKQCKEKQKSISSFFTVKVNDQNQSGKLTDSQESNCESKNLEEFRSTSDSLDNDHSSDSASQSSGSSQDNSCPQLTQKSKDSKIEGSIKSSQTKNQGWGFLMKGPKPLPLCPGHKEPCVLQTVKKKGPNINRQFYACARGVGKEGDPNARCNFFKWASK
ncbi:DNA-(apurinic or apyrimidinic site) endonuclease 2-like isoform X1 [Eriocheir sinensis]|uniref:DNA-(apurinic or apyrimidinic site) endonuclease 2-like isoform X1 n=1 Tax=Eriocheir sinensis TaxID=95602 RepID=UPI0021C8E929|nr:DNA-(apurinic or apyrimidinic site) endonuclease 2-like isoform X1 [Eriocheir sinensis]